MVSVEEIRKIMTSLNLTVNEDMFTTHARFMKPWTEEALEEGLTQDHINRTRYGNLTIHPNFDKMVESLKKRPMSRRTDPSLSNEICIIEGCENTIKNQMLCSKHYQQQLNIGRSFIRKTIKKSISNDRISSRYSKLKYDNVIQLLLMQKGLCYYTNAPLDLCMLSNFSMSPDRLDNSEGHVISNICLVAYIMNKTDHTPKYDRKRIFDIITMSSQTSPPSCMYPSDASVDRKRDRNGNPIDPVLYLPSRRANILAHQSNFSTKRRKSKGRDLCDSEITRETIISIWNTQAGRCYYSNIPLNIASGENFMMSLERLNDKVGYTVNNSVLIAYEFNIGSERSFSRDLCKDLFGARFLQDD